MTTQLLLSPAFSPDKKIYLQPVRVSGVEIDICPQSGGLWFDRFELNKFDEVHEDLDELLKILPQNPKSPEILTGRQSPRHPGVIMQQQPYGPKGANGALTVDKCPVSGGVWLDFQELQKIRELYPTAAEKEKAINEFVNQAFKGLPKSPQSTNEMGMITSLLTKILK